MSKTIAPTEIVISAITPALRNGKTNIASTPETAPSGETRIRSNVPATSSWRTDIGSTTMAAVMTSSIARPMIA